VDIEFECSELCVLCIQKKKFPAPRIELWNDKHLLKSQNQGIGIKGNKMELVWHEKASCTALQTSTVNLTHTLLVQTHNMTTV